MSSLSRRDFLKAAGLGTTAVAAAAVLASCSSSDDSSSSSSSSSDSSSSSSSETTATSTEATNIETVDAEEAEYTEIIAGVGTNWDTPTPWRSNTANDAYCAHYVFETLAIQEEDKEYHPWCAKSWSTEDNGYSYEIELFDYITDQEGRNITASDVVWFLETSKAKALKPNFANIDTVEETGDYSFHVTLTSNQIGVIELIFFDTFIVSQEAVEASGDDFATSCCSTSPYKLTSFTASVNMVFEKTDNYWQTDESLLQPDCIPVIDKLTLAVYSEASQLGNALEAGEIDFAIELDATVATMYEGDSNYSIQEFSKANAIQAFFSGYETRPVAEDVNLRKAIAYSIDIDMIINSCYSGYATAMHDVCNEKAVGYLEKWNDEEYYGYDLDKAAECLAESNYNGESIVILASSSFKTIAEILMSGMDAIGVTSELLTGDLAWITANRLDGSLYDIFINQVGCETLANLWSIRFDPAAYSTGDGTSRHDYELAEMLYSTWTVDGYTEENIDAVHNYIKEQMYAYGLVDHHNLNVWNNNVNMIECVSNYYGRVSVSSCRFAER